MLQQHLHPMACLLALHPRRSDLAKHPLHAVLGEGDGHLLELQEDAEVEGNPVLGEVLLELFLASRVPLDCGLQRRELVLHGLQLVGQRAPLDPLRAEGIHGGLELLQVLHPPVRLPQHLHPLVRPCSETFEDHALVHEQGETLLHLLNKQLQVLEVVGLELLDLRDEILYHLAEDLAILHNLSHVRALSLQLVFDRQHGLRPD
mmetsp:Transcript_37320/g.117586  ORF Transcript_37320/g.117586 Transcript_37320/m.117586 type:complete len:204 (+) Transcript_37320:197-808(+)